VSLDFISTIEWLLAIIRIYFSLQEIHKTKTYRKRVKHYEKVSQSRVFVR